jgi:uncharacterized protein (DUF608 family)
MAGVAGALRGSVHAGAHFSPPSERVAAESRAFSAPYVGKFADRVAFPLGGIGAGMICLEGSGALSHASLLHRPDVRNEPCAYAAVSIRGGKPVARVLEGPVPEWKLFGRPDGGRGGENTTYGLPRFARSEFAAKFPFASVDLQDESVPLQVRLTGWSPFTPPDADDSSLPVAALEYRFSNPTAGKIQAVFSYHAANFLAVGGQSTRGVSPIAGGFVLRAVASPGSPWAEGSFAAMVDDPATRVNHAWYRGRFRDWLSLVWKDVETGACYDRPPVTDTPPARGASLFVPFDVAPGDSKTIALRLCWHAPSSNLRTDAGYKPVVPTGGVGAGEKYYQPWYPARFADIAAVAAHWRERYAGLREASGRFADCLHDSTLPAEITEAVTANLGILKSPTVLRQADGRMWGWEGCNDDIGSCAGSCTHVWNYAQAVAHLFPSLERTLRETEFGPAQDQRGHQNFRASLPIRVPEKILYAAADGQLGGLMKFYRDWRISGDNGWLHRWWPRVRQSLDYCIETWDPARKGWVEEPHHNTYDISFWGPDGMVTSIYLGALHAAVQMGRALGEDIGGYEELYAAGRNRLEGELFNGEYFFHRPEWKNLRAGPPENDFKNKTPAPSADEIALIKEIGPLYQYGTGCLSDGVIGAWFSEVCGLGEIIAPAKVASHLQAVYRNNFKPDLTLHANSQRSTFAQGSEGGLVLCTWPKGGRPPLPFVYAGEVWTGIEYQVASHLIMTGHVGEGLAIVRACRARYDGRVRNPFNEYECGHWYARALSSYALLQAMSGARYDAVEQVLHLRPSRPGDFRCFLATATGYGTVGVRHGEPFLEVRSGSIPVTRINYQARA